MPSPLPGMDPFIESQGWTGFHTRFITAISDAIVPQVRPRYVSLVEERVYLEHQTEEEHETFLTIRRTGTLEEVTVIEVLSPQSKRLGADDRGEYLHKRGALLRSGAHLVELDILRGGERLPTKHPLPPADYYAFVSRERRRPNAEVWAWWLPQRMPAVPIPLADGDADVTLDIQAVFDTVYDRAGYDYSLGYGSPAKPPLDEEGTAWVQEILAGRPKH